MILFPALTPDFLSRVANMKKLGIKTDNNYKFDKLEKIHLDEGFIEIVNDENQTKKITNN